VTEPCQDVELSLAEAARTVEELPAARLLLGVAPTLRAELVALLVLARMDEAVVTPVFARSSAAGSLMRRKIEPVLHAVLAQIAMLRRTAHG